MAANVDKTSFIDNLEILYPLFNSFKAFICVINDTHQIEFINQALLEFLNLTTNNYKKYQTQQLFPDLNFDTFQNTIKIIHPQSKKEVNLPLKFTQKLPNLVVYHIAEKDLSEEISSHQEAEDHDNQLFQNFFLSIQDPAAIWQLDQSNHFILRQYNQPTALLTNHKVKDFVGITIEDFYESNPALVKHYYNTLESGKPIRVEMPYQMVTTGKEVWIIANYIKIAEDKILNIFSDISERKLMEIRAVENERQLKTLLGNLPGMVYRCLNDNDWTMVFVSEGCYDLTGYDPLDLIQNRKIAYNLLVHPDDQQRIWKEIQNALEKKKKFELIYRIQTADQTEKWVWERGQGIFDKEGQLFYLEGFITDISKRIQSENETKKAQQQAEALREALEEITTQLNLSEVLRKILDSLKKVLFYDKATLFLKLDGQIKIVAARGFDNTGKLVDRTFPSSHLLIQEIDRKQKPVILKDTVQDKRFEDWVTQNMNTWMGIPLIRNQNTIGYLTLDNNNQDGYNQEEADIAQLFANGAAVVIENAKLYEKSQLLATSDSLTSINNRRHFYELANIEFNRSKRYGTPLSVIMLDIDHFKYVNDKYGHQVGDQILIKFVKRVNQSLRTSDVFARYGGEEFIILLPETENLQAIQVAERIRSATAETPFDIQKVSPYITISLGVATLDGSCENLDTLIDRSDKALYEAKQIGRNRVRSWNR